MGLFALSAVLGIAGTVLGAIEADEAQKAQDAKEKAAELEAKRIREDTRVEEAGAKLQVGVSGREQGSTLDFLNPLSIGG